MPPGCRRITFRRIFPDVVQGREHACLQLFDPLRVSGETRLGSRQTASCFRASHTNYPTWWAMVLAASTFHGFKEVA